MEFYLRRRAAAASGACLGRRRYGPKMLHDEPNHSAPDRAYSENRRPGLRDDGRRSAEQQTKEQTHRPTGPCQASDADDKSNRKSIEKGCGQSGALIWKGMWNHGGHHDESEHQSAESSEHL